MPEIYRIVNNTCIKADAERFMALKDEIEKILSNSCFYDLHSVTKSPFTTDVDPYYKNMTSKQFNTICSIISAVSIASTYYSKMSELLDKTKNILKQIFDYNLIHTKDFALQGLLNQAFIRLYDTRNNANKELFENFLEVLKQIREHQQINKSNKELNDVYDELFEFYNTHSIELMAAHAIKDPDLSAKTGDWKDNLDEFSEYVVLNSFEDICNIYQENNKNKLLSIVNLQLKNNKNKLNDSSLLNKILLQMVTRGKMGKEKLKWLIDNHDNVDIKVWKEVLFKLIGDNEYSENCEINTIILLEDWKYKNDKNNPLSNGIGVINYPSTHGKLLASMLKNQINAIHHQELLKNIIKGIIENNDDARNIKLFDIFLSKLKSKLQNNTSLTYYHLMRIDNLFEYNAKKIIMEIENATHKHEPAIRDIFVSINQDIIENEGLKKIEFINSYLRKMRNNDGLKTSEERIKKLAAELIKKYRANIRSFDGCRIERDAIREFCKNFLYIDLPPRLEKGEYLSLDSLILEDCKQSRKKIDWRFLAMIDEPQLTTGFESEFSERELKMELIAYITHCHASYENQNNQMNALNNIVQNS